MEQAEDDAGDEEEDLDDGGFEIEEMEAGDEFMAVKPWLGAMKAPSNFEPDPKQRKAPNVKLELEYCHGYRAKDCRNNLRYLKNGKVLYHAAALGIVHTPSTNKQKFFNQHSDDITAMALSSDKTTVVTGELGKRPLIQLWDAETQELIATAKSSKIRNGVAALAFSPNGEMVVAVGID